MSGHQISGPLKTKLLASGGVLGAILASACCVLPLGFAFLGVSGAWIGELTSLAPYQPFFLMFAALCIGFGFWRAYGYSGACEEACGTPLSRRLTKVALWIAALVLAVAATADWWAPLFA